VLFLDKKSKKKQRNKKKKKSIPEANVFMKTLFGCNLNSRFSSKNSAILGVSSKR
jgi:hypothetical protein